jgi:uncharacterized membrane protein
MDGLPMALNFRGRPATENLTMAMFNTLLAIHVLSVVWWIGGVFTVTTSLLPIFNRLPPPERIERNNEFEHPIANQARIAVLLVGITGFWMYTLVPGAIAHTWWVGLMLLVWVLFTVLLFVAEPLRLPAKLGVIHNPRKFLVLHAVLLTLALAAIAGGVIGARGGW